MHRRQVVLAVLRHEPAGRRSGAVVGRHRLGVPAVDAREAAKLALDAVEPAVGVAVAHHDVGPGDGVHRLDAGDRLHDERQARGPGAPGAAVLQVEPRRRRVGDGRLRADTVGDGAEQVRLGAAQQVDIAERGPCVGRIAARPHEARRARSEEVRDAGRRQRVGQRQRDRSYAHSTRCPPG